MGPALPESLLRDRHDSTSHVQVRLHFVFQSLWVHVQNRLEVLFEGPWETDGLVVVRLVGHGALRVISRVQGGSAPSPQRDLGAPDRQSPDKVSVDVNVKQGPWGNGKVGDHYKWVALINTTMGMLMATIDGSIMLISLPDIFRGIRLDPLQPGNSFYLLWMILSFLVVTSVLVVNLGRLGDIYGRVRMYNLGFAIFTFFSLLLTITWMSGAAAGLWLIVVRVFQGIGAAFLVANSSAILTDAFPEDQRGMALGINQAAAISGTFIGLVLGGVLAPINWRLIFLVSVPIGLFGTVWGYLQLREVGRRTRAHIDWPGNLTFAFGLVSLMIGHHLRHRAARGPHHGLDLSGGARRARRRGRPADRLRHHRDRASTTRCSASRSSASAPSRPASWPASWPR